MIHNQQQINPPILVTSERNIPTFKIQDRHIPLRIIVVVTLNAVFLPPFSLSLSLFLVSQRGRLLEREYIASFAVGQASPATLAAALYRKTITIAPCPLRTMAFVIMERLFRAFEREERELGFFACHNSSLPTRGGFF